MIDLCGPFLSRPNTSATSSPSFGQQCALRFCLFRRLRLMLAAADALAQRCECGVPKAELYSSCLVDPGLHDPACRRCMCPRTTIRVSSDYCICPRTKLYSLTLLLDQRRSAKGVTLPVQQLLLRVGREILLECREIHVCATAVYRSSYVSLCTFVPVNQVN